MDSDSSSVDYASAEDEPDEIYCSTPSSPLSDGSGTCRTSTHINHDPHWTIWVAYIFSWILLPVRFLLRIPFLLFRLLSNRESKASLDTGSPHPRTFHPFRRVHSSKDHVVQRTIDRRRGVIEVYTRTYILLPLEFFCFHHLYYDFSLAFYLTHCYAMPIRTFI